jgi:hypothetical protein
MRIQLKRGNSIATKNYTGLLGELVINTDNSIPTIHDGVTPGGLNLEGVVYSTNTPGIISPINGSLNVPIQPYIQSNAFAGFGTHAATYWEIATDVGFSNRVYISGRDIYNLEFINLNALNVALDQLSTYYVRVRHESSVGVLSDWSVATRFKTGRLLDGLDASLLMDLAAVENDYFGYSAAISKDGETMVISSIGGGVISGGVVDIYAKEFSSWVFKDRVESSSESSYSFGHTVELSDDGTVAAVGSLLDNVVYIYHIVGEKLILRKTINAPVNPTAGNFGYATSLSGDGKVLAISVCGVGSSDPVVYTYSDVDDWTSYKTVVNGSVNANSGFGYSISLNVDGTILAIGASRLDTSSGIGSGAVIIYKYIDNTWVDDKFILPDVGYINANFGHSVSISADGYTLAIGAYNYLASTVGGSVTIYRSVDNLWIKDTVILPSPYVSYSRFGSVSLSDGGNILVVGASDDSTVISGGGAIYVYINVDGIWTLHSKNQPVTSYESSKYGRMVSISGDGLTIITGAYNQPFNGYNSVGVVHILS